MKKAVAIISGGLDSSVLAYLLRKEGYNLHLLSFDYGQRHRRELESAKSIASNFVAPWMARSATHHIVDIKSAGKLLAGSSLTDPDIAVPDGHYAAESMKKTVVPNRNAIMLAIAYGMAVGWEANIVATAVHAGDHYIYPDCRPPFLSALEHAFQLGNEGFGKPAIYAPFISLSKADIVKIGVDLDVPFADTWSCYKGGATHCGTCGTCVERKEAFTLAGVPDPTEYLSELKES